MNANHPQAVPRNSFDDVASRQDIKAPIFMLFDLRYKLLND
jgi:hypothetical protein